MLQASDGNLYGTTVLGGTNGGGTVFKITNPGGTPTESVVYSFAGGTDGANPYASLIQASDGNLYGTSYWGGASGLGTVFEISNLGGTPAESVVYSFAGGTDGANPYASLIQASDGNLYGTTYGGGASGLGTVFEISNLGGTPTESVIYSFAGGADGANPNTSLIQASDGDLYGTAFWGGASGLGTVFEISNLGGIPIESVIYSFARGADGANPHSSLIQASDGNLYGTTVFGGTNGGGTVFKMSNLGGTPAESVVYSFTGSADGANPDASLIQASDGNLYGTTIGGGASGLGTVFEISNQGGTPTESVVYSFTGGTDGANPYASLIQASDGNLYGTTGGGGASGVGTVFEISNPGGTPTESIVYSFAGGADGANPQAGLIQASDGDLYGTTSGGGASGLGTVFKISNPGGTPTESVIYSFIGGVDGGYPYASLLQASDGNLYGTTVLGGTNGSGTVFMISDPGGTPTESVIYSFTGGTDGANPYASLIQASDGNLYGTTYWGGTSGVGTVFEISNPGGTPTESVVYSFTGGTDGANPYASLIQASNGNLYGTTVGGGTSGGGTVFEIRGLGGTPTESVIYSFIEGADGAFPYAPLLQASDGNIYGTTVVGGTSDLGTVFNIAGICPPVAATVTPSGPTTFCAGGSVTLDAGAGYAAYLWSPGGETTQTVVVSASGSYSVTVTDGNGCQGTSAPVAVTVNPLPTPTIAPSGATTFCAGGSVTLDAGAGYSAYLWSPGGETTQTIVVSASGSYSVTVTDANGCQGTSAPTVVTVNPNPMPVITVSHCLTPNTSGLTASAPANAGDTYSWTITGGTIDSGQGTDTISFTSGGPATLMTLSVDETTTAGCTGNAADSMQVNFNDVPPSNPFYTFVCTIARHGITAGCGGGNFCPSNSVLRSQMAVFLLVGEHGTGYTPPACAGIFTDVACPGPFTNFIEELYNEGITGGCSTNPLLYCPNNNVSRAGMAVFLLVAEHGTGYTPPACTGIFTDVACPGPFTNWIEDLYNEGVTGGCNTNPLMYCPGNFVTRAQMAVFLTATFALP